MRHTWIRHTTCGGVVSLLCHTWRRRVTCKRVMPRVCTAQGYGVASISRLLKIVGLFCKRALSKRRYSQKETYNLQEPTTCSHPIPHVEVSYHNCDIIGLFCKRALYQRDDILQKRLVIWRSLLIIPHKRVVSHMKETCHVCAMCTLHSCRSLFQNIVSLIGLFCKSDIQFYAHCTRVTWGGYD